MRLARWMGALSVSALLLGACGAQEITAQEIMKRFEAARANTKTAHATFEVQLSGMQAGRSSGGGHFVIENWMSKSDKLDPTGQPMVLTHMKVLESDTAEMVGGEIINDGTTAWVYSPSQNQVIRGDLSELNSGAVGAQDPTAQLNRIQQMIQQVLDGSNVEILATNEPVAGRDAWKLEADAQARDQPAAPADQRGRGHDVGRSAARHPAEGCD